MKTILCGAMNWFSVARERHATLIMSDGTKYEGAPVVDISGARSNVRGPNLDARVDVALLAPCNTQGRAFLSTRALQTSLGCGGFENQNGPRAGSFKVGRYRREPPNEEDFVGFEIHQESHFAWPTVCRQGTRVEEQLRPWEWARHNGAAWCG